MSGNPEREVMEKLRVAHITDTCVTLDSDEADILLRYIERLRKAANRSAEQTRGEGR